MSGYNLEVKQPVADVNEPQVVAEHHGFATDIDHVPKGYFTTRYFLGTYVAHIFTFLGGLAGFNLIAPILGDINNDIGPSESILWLALVYPLGLAVGLGLMGRVTDIFGRRWFMIIGNLLGTIGAVVCSRAHTINTLIGGETLIGFGSTAAYSFNFVISEIVPMKYRFWALGGLFFFCLPMNGFNTIVATSFVVHTEQGWRWCYYLILILNAIATVLYFLFYHPPTFEMKHKGVSKRQILKEFDYVGAFGLMTGVTLFLIGLNWGGGLYSWNDAHVIATMAVGGVIIFALPVWEAFSKVKDPFIPLRLFRSRGWTVSMLSSSIGATVYYSFSIIWPSMVSVVYARGDQIWAGWASCLVAMGIAVGQVIGNALTLAVTRQKIQCIVAMTVGTIFLGAAATCNADDKGKAMAFVFLSCLFIGWNEAVVATLVGVCIQDQRDIGVAAGLSGCIRSLLGSVSSAIYSAVLRSRLNHTVPAHVTPAVVAAGLPKSSVEAFVQALSIGTSAAFDKVEGVTPGIIAAGTQAYRVANVDAYRTVFLSSLAFGGLCIILNLMIPNVDKLMNRDIAVRLHATNEKNASDTVGDKPLHEIKHVEKIV
ncbi:uncharacterized protein PV07_04155 [Cladophialophora immunda]|uniref:Major facilitator superfamily (MFS) profile domain-containing protein n=1 Tax=Cladophialophora immunda TaxID=569365 RepID=A0A0D2DA94_9EURO|nr:uncharacterized protein PV07_04155 [Cladophialophora immunda]KIW32624.1 hypothetical protein PV07_04155 [Cladophialophora immunda]